MHTCSVAHVAGRIEGSLENQSRLGKCSRCSIRERTKILITCFETKIIKRKRFKYQRKQTVQGFLKITNFEIVEFKSSISACVVCLLCIDFELD